VLLLVLISGVAGRDGRRLAELEGLVRSAGGEPVGVVGQRRSSGAAPTLWGEGKLREAALEARRLGASLMVTDRELTPVQARNLERIVDLPVSDRSELILDIFAQRAASAAGRLQVELAQLRYRLPRLSGRGLSLSRQGGGIGTRGPGETQLEKDRRAIARRIERLQRDVRELGEHRARLRQGRRGQRRLALVGYTNAGKSSLLNALSGARAGEGVLAENRLFATLDPTTRRVRLGGPNDGSLPAANDPDAGAAREPRPHGFGDEESVPELPLLLTDTVGFIEDLPPQLVEAFRSTLEEALEADGLLLVVDLSDPAWPEQLASVNGLLDRLGATPPRLVIGNQIDRCPAGELDRAQALVPGMLFISATADLGLQNLRRHLSHWPASGVDPAALADRGPDGSAAGRPRGPVPTSKG
jgi:GTP-binding protein HflX